MKKYFASEYWLGPITFLTSMWFINLLLGLFAISPHDALQSKESQAAFIMPLTAAIAWWGASVIKNYSTQSLAIVITHGHRHHMPRVKIWLKDLLDEKSKKKLPFIVIASFPFVYFFGFEIGFLNDNYGLNYQNILFVQAWMTSVFFFSLLFLIYLGQRLVTMHLRKKLRIRLFEIEQFSPICQLTLLHFFIPCLILTVTAAGVFFDSYTKLDIYLVFISFIITFCFLTYPMLTIRGVLGIRREQSLKRLNKVLNIQTESNEILDNRRLVDDFERLQYVSDLLTVRKEINSMSLWPMDLPFAVKMGIVAMIPIFSWVGAGIISQLIKAVS